VEIIVTVKPFTNNKTIQQVITDSMTLIEVRQHLANEITELEGSVQKKYEAVKKKLAKAHQKFWHTTVTTKNKNRYDVYLTVRDNTNRGEFTFYALIFTTYKKEPIAVSSFHIFTKHFFERYCERSGLPEMTMKEAAMKFFKNSELRPAIAFRKESDDSIQLPLRTGVSFVVMDASGLAVHKTFVSLDMLNGEQPELFVKTESASNVLNKLIAETGFPTMGIGEW